MFDRSDNARFWAKVDKQPEGCWVWQAGKDWDGYGIFHACGRSWRAHRWAYESLVAPIPDGLVIDHLCRNRACVNPDHLEPVTDRVNILRGEGVAAVNADKAACDKGHPLPPDRKCRTCAAIAARIHKGWDPEVAASTPIEVARADRTHCKNGHEFTEDNTWVEANGHRHCRACHRERSRAAYRKKKEHGQDQG